MNHSTRHLVIGASGKTGARVINGLKKLGYQPQGASRNGDVIFDWNDESTWAPALTNIDAVYLTYYPDLAIPKAPSDISKFSALAKLKGIKHITLLSGRGEPAAQACEKIIINSGLSWTIVRASWFNQNFSEGMFRSFIMNGEIALPVDYTSEPFIDVNYIADVVIASLTNEDHCGELYEVTGPELLNFSQLAELFTKHLNRPVSFKQISLESFQSNLKDAGIDAGAIAALTYLFTEVLDGRNEYLTDGVNRALGRSAKSFSVYIDDNKQWFEEGVSND